MLYSEKSLELHCTRSLMDLESQARVAARSSSDAVQVTVARIDKEQKKKELQATLKRI